MLKVRAFHKIPLLEISFGRVVPARRRVHLINSDKQLFLGVSRKWAISNTQAVYTPLVLLRGCPPQLEDLKSI